MHISLVNYDSPKQTGRISFRSAATLAKRGLLIAKGDISITEIMLGCHRPVELTKKGEAWLSAPKEMVDKAMKLTPSQAEELGRLTKAAQNTYGKIRSRIQNTLVAHGLASFDADRCLITDLGRQVCMLLS